LYTKSTVLYGLDKAKQEIRRLNYTIFVEGQMDLVMSHQAGIKNTVAVSGTALSDAITTTVKDTTESPLADPTVVVNNLGVVRRLSPNLILAFDSDSAGRKAALRSAQIALSLGMDVKIAQMQDGKDPADMVLKSVDTWKDVLRKAKPVVEFELDQVLAEMAEKKLDQRKLPALLREKVYPFIAALDSNTDQGAYVKLVREKAFGNSESEQFIWDDLKEIKKKMKVDTARDSTTRQSGHSSATIRPTAMASRLDLISRKLFGLLAYLAREKLLETDGIHARVRSIAGDERYNNLIQNTTPSIDELILEAELFFGPEKVSEKNLVKVKKDIDEMLLNFEEDIIKEDFASAMAELMRIEKSGDVNAQKILMEKFQMLNTKKAEIERKKQS
jgi:DNA primase